MHFFSCIKTYICDHRCILLIPCYVPNHLPLQDPGQERKASQSHCWGGGEARRPCFFYFDEYPIKIIQLNESWLQYDGKHFWIRYIYIVLCILHFNILRSDQCSKHVAGSSATRATTALGPGVPCTDTCDTVPQDLSHAEVPDSLSPTSSPEIPSEKLREQYQRPLEAEAPATKLDTPATCTVYKSSWPFHFNLKIGNTFNAPIHEYDQSPVITSFCGSGTFCCGREGGELGTEWWWKQSLD